MATRVNITLDDDSSRVIDRLPHGTRSRAINTAVRFRQDHRAQPAGRTDPPFTGEGVDRRPGDIGTSGQGAGESTAFADRICLPILQPVARADCRGECGVHDAATGGACRGTPRAGAAVVSPISLPPLSATMSSKLAPDGTVMSGNGSSVPEYLSETQRS